MEYPKGHFNLPKSSKGKSFGLFFFGKEKIMWNEPSKEKLETIPKLYETENIPVKEKQIYLHFFFGGCDWYIAEYDGDDLLWGFAILDNDYFNAEWGYISFEELKQININNFQIDCEINWKVSKSSEIEKICKGNNWHQQMVHEEN